MWRRLTGALKFIGALLFAALVFVRWVATHIARFLSTRIYELPPSTLIAAYPKDLFIGLPYTPRFGNAF